MIMNFGQLFKLNLMLINIAGYIRYFQYLILHHEYFSLVKRNEVLKNDENRNKTLYVCALGPSLKDVDLDKITGDTIVVNRFYKYGVNNPLFIPTYYLIVDSKFANPDCKKDFDDCINAYVSKGTKYILNSKCAKHIPEALRNNIYFFSTFKGEFNASKKLDMAKVMPSVGNVASAAIACGISMGYKKIILIGCDFNSFASPISVHCYEEKEQKRQIQLYYELFRYAFASHTHKELAEYAKQNEIEIINSTKGTLIDSYPILIDASLYNN